jgi:hypothetical protein
MLFKKCIKKSNNLLLKNKIPIINYISKDCKNNEKIVFNKYNNLINNINNSYILGLKLLCIFFIYIIKSKKL